MIFISYSSKDEAPYTSLCLALESANLPYWKGSLKAGTSLKEQLREAITRCDVCIFIATRNSVGAQWCMNEIGAFWGVGKRIIPYAADNDIKNKLPPLFEGDYWTSDAREVMRQVKEELDKSAGRGVDFIDRASRRPSTYPVLEELEKHIEGLQEISEAPDYQGESAASLLSEVEHLIKQMGGLSRLSQGEIASHMLLKDIQRDLDKLQRKLRADERLKPHVGKLLTLMSGDRRLLDVLLEAFGGRNGVLRERGSTLMNIFRGEEGEQIRRVEVALADAGYRTELALDEEHGLWEIETVTAAGNKVRIDWALAQRVEFRKAVEIYNSL